MPNCLSSHFLSSHFLSSHCVVSLWLVLVATISHTEVFSQEIKSQETAVKAPTTDENAGTSTAETSTAGTEADADAAADLLSPQQRNAAIDRWEKDITRLESLDQSEPDHEDAVLLVGSSSIRLWEGATDALAPYPVIRRGYGGAKYSDLSVYAKRLIEPHSFRALVCFVGNDISGGKGDHAVADVEKWVRSIIAIARDHQPDAMTLLVEVTPTPSRFDAWPKIRRLNAMLREVALTERNVSFVATAEFYLNRDDQPRLNLFRDDHLHLNETGYQIWASLIKRRLDEVLSEE